MHVNSLYLLATKNTRDVPRRITIWCTNKLIPKYTWSKFINNLCSQIKFLIYEYSTSCKESKHGKLLHVVLIQWLRAVFRRNNKNKATPTPIFLTFHRLANPKCHLSPFENLILVREYVRNKNGLPTEENIRENIFPRGGSVDCPPGNVSSCCTSSVSCSLISIRSSIPYHESVIWT